jgi:hypothetical protein
MKRYNVPPINGKETRWMQYATCFRANPFSTLISGNFMSNPKSNWSNPQNAPPSCWKGRTDGST